MKAGPVSRRLLRQLSIGAAVLVAAAGCSSMQPADNFDAWAARAVSADVVAARDQAELTADNLFAYLPVKPVAVSSVDSCVVDDDVWHSQTDQFSCSLEEIRYVPVDGALLPLLVKIDHAALTDGLVASEPLQNVQYYFAHKGKAEGLQLPKPRLAYEGGFGIVAVNWNDPAFPQPMEAPTTYPARWPTVYRTQTPALDVAKLSAGHDNMLAILVSQTYFKIPWSASTG